MCEGFILVLQFDPSNKTFWISPLCNISSLLPSVLGKDKLDLLKKFNEKFVSAEKKNVPSRPWGKRFLISALELVSLY